jgi:hypothetical protein
MPSFTSFSEITLALQKSRLHQFAPGIRQLPAYGRARRIGRVKPARCSPKKTFFVIVDTARPDSRSILTTTNRDHGPRQ